MKNHYTIQLAVLLLLFALQGFSQTTQTMVLEVPSELRDNGNQELQKLRPKLDLTITQIEPTIICEYENETAKAEAERKRQK